MEWHTRISELVLGQFKEAERGDLDESLVKFEDDSVQGIGFETEKNSKSEWAFGLSLQPVTG